MNAVIRHANLDDLDAIVAVEQASFPEGRWASAETFKTRLSLNPQGAFVAELDGEIVGYCVGFSIKDLSTLEKLDPVDTELFLEGSPIYLLRSVGVKSDCQKKGVGSQLVRKQIEAAKEQGAQSFRFTATPNLENFYKSLGFNRVTDYGMFHGVEQAVWITNVDTIL